MNDEIEIQVYVRKPFYVEAVLVTEENMETVAAWCNGNVQTYKKNPDRYIKVQVANPRSSRQTRAYAGDWVLKAEGESFKVYRAEPFNKVFDKTDFPVIPD